MNIFYINKMKFIVELFTNEDKSCNYGLPVGKVVRCSTVRILFLRKLFKDDIVVSVWLYD